MSGGRIKPFTYYLVVCGRILFLGGLFWRLGALAVNGMVGEAGPVGGRAWTHARSEYIFTFHYIKHTRASIHCRCGI